MLQAGERAPSFTLSDVQGKPIPVDPSAAPLTLVVIFKTTCPTCHYAWQYYERLYRAYAPAGLQMVGVSQHDAARTRAYQREYGATFPHLTDEAFRVSREYDPAFVPTAFLIDSKGTVLQTLES